jgi:hypothetical protein
MKLEFMSYIYLNRVDVVIILNCTVTTSSPHTHPNLLSQAVRKVVMIHKVVKAVSVRVCNRDSTFDGENLRWWQSTETR